MVSSAPNAEELARFYCGIWANDSPGEPLEGELKASAYTNLKSTTQKHINKTNQLKGEFTKKWWSQSVVYDEDFSNVFYV